MNAATALMNNISSGLFHNPVLMKELRVNLRGRKVFIIQTIYLAILGLISIIFLLDVSGRRYIEPSYMAQAGRGYFLVITIVQGIMIALLSPSLTTSSISSEREKKSYEMLIVSLLSELQIVLGKLMSALSQVLLLIASSLPVVSLVFFTGGVSPLEVAFGYLFLFVCSLIFCSLGLYFSSRQSMSSTATFQCYGVIVILGISFLVMLDKFRFFDILFNRTLFNTKPSVLALWAVLIYNVLWSFLFFLYKSANNIRHRARWALALHRLFLFGFPLNIMGYFIFIAFMQGAGLYHGNYLSVGTSDLLASLWASFLVTSMFFMGCFVKNQDFPSRKEREIFGKSMTSKISFFAGFFVLLAAALTVLSFFFGQGSAGDEMILMKSIISLVLFIFFLGSLILFSREIHSLFDGRYKMAYIYYPLFLVFNIIPLLWFVSNPFYYDNDSLFSVGYIQPANNLIDLWRTPGEKILSGNAGKLMFINIISFLAIFGVLKIIRKIISSKQAKSGKLPLTTT